MDPFLRLAVVEANWPERADDFVGLTLAEQAVLFAELLDSDLPEDEPVWEAYWGIRSNLKDAVPEGVADDRIRSLAGVEAFPELSTLYLEDSYVADLRPLRLLPLLTKVYLDGPPDVDLTPLLACPNLKRVHFEQSVTAGAEILRTLAGRGVQVDDLVPYSDGKPFGCANLRLAVLDTLQKVVKLPATYPFDPYRYDRDNLYRVLAVEITQEQLDTIEVLHWLGGGHTTAHLVWEQWDGESDEFHITSLAGIEALRNLRALRVSPLSAIPADQVAALRTRGVSVAEWGVPVVG